ncbi:hypothetical protein K501DRAFT_277506 [Backusella circina FSU 941]|nr:hypothetical protein K501DRAFT_277506 [Backusella circina FSU 941]
MMKRKNVKNVENGNRGKNRDSRIGGGTRLKEYPIRGKELLNFEKKLLVYLCDMITYVATSTAYVTKFFLMNTKYYRNEPLFGYNSIIIAVCKMYTGFTLFFVLVCIRLRQRFFYPLVQSEVVRSDGLYIFERAREENCMSTLGFTTDYHDSTT